jgi:hypothetical protein
VFGEPATEPAVETISFEELLAQLPAGCFAGAGQPPFGVAARPEVFIPPTLTVVDRPDTPAVVLISARGATGKSTLAQQLSHAKRVPLWRLDADRAVSADALESRLNGYLDAADPLARFAKDDAAFIVIDALDEARMRVSGLSWTEYLESIAAVAASGQHFVLFGRERILEDVWLGLDEAGLAVAWFELSHFDSAQRAAYVDHKVERERNVTDEAYRAARDAVLTALAGTVDTEHADSFVGYAPVLDAVVALLRKGNLKAVENTFAADDRDRERIAVLVDILESLLDREQAKTRALADQLGLDQARVYTPSEQLEWLAAEIMGGDQPELAWCPEELRPDYVTQIEEFLRDHPFRAESQWASPVFGAYVAAKRFDDPQIREPLRRIGSATGLLFEFVATERTHLLIDEWQFAALHVSLLSAEWQAVEAVVSIETADPEAVHEVAQADQATGEMVLIEDGAVHRRVPFDLVLDRSGELSLVGPMASLSVAFPGIVVGRPPAASLTLGPDCFVRCVDLRLESETIQVARRGQGINGHSEEASVVLEVTGRFRCDGSLTGTPPPAAFELRVPPTHALSYPWVSYRRDLEPSGRPANERAVRFLNMLMNTVRSHGHKGSMAVFEKKLEGRQSIKGEEFRTVVAALEEMGVLRTAGEMIHLEPEWESRRYSGKRREGLASLDDQIEAWEPVLDRISAVIEK